MKDRDRCRVAALLPRVQPFILSGYSGQPTRGTVTIHEFRREQRARRAFAVLGKWWGVALLCVFIPVAHFVLVPSFLAYGLWEFFQRIGTSGSTSKTGVVWGGGGGVSLVQLGPALALLETRFITIRTNGGAKNCFPVSAGVFLGRR